MLFFLINMSFDDTKFQLLITQILSATQNLCSQPPKLCEVSYTIYTKKHISATIKSPLPSLDGSLRRVCLVEPQKEVRVNGGSTKVECQEWATASLLLLQPFSRFPTGLLVHDRKFCRKVAGTLSWNSLSVKIFQKEIVQTLLQKDMEGSESIHKRIF